MKRLIISFAVLALLIVSNLAFGDDLDDLKAADDRHFKAFAARDAATFSAMAHPELVAFARNAAFALPNRELSIKSLQDWFATLESLSITPIDYQYKVIGNTGIVWGYNIVTYKPKDGSQQTYQQRQTSTWIKSGGKWLALLSHASAIPSGD